MVKQYELYWVDLNPTKGGEISKIRPCLIITPDEMNDPLRTVMVAPLTSNQRENYPMRVNVKVDNKEGSVALDQIRTIDKSRFKKRLGYLDKEKIAQVKSVLFEMLIK